MNKKIAIIGAGGHGKVVGEIALLNQYDVIDFFDDKINEIKNFPFTICGNLDQLKINLKYYNDFFVAIGENNTRQDKISILRKAKANIVTLIHHNLFNEKFPTEK